VGEKDDKIDVSSKKVNENIIIASNINKHSQLHAEASSQMIQALNGVRYDSQGNDIGHLGRSLKDISNYKLNPDYEANNIRQQAGFSAELVTEARENAKRILNGNTNRIRTADGIGKSNDQVNDLYTINKNGSIDSNKSAQSKFLSNTKNPEHSHKKVVDNFIKDPDWEKYANSEMSIPSNQFEKAKKYAEEQRLKFLEQSERAKNPEVKEKLLAKAKKAEQIRDLLKNSDMTSEEAIQARLHPKVFVAKETIKNIHNSSVEVAKGAAVVVGTIAIGKNIYEVITNDKNIEDAVKDTLVETATASAKAYTINTSATTMAVIMKNSANSTIRKIGSSSAPVAITTAVFEIGSSLKRYAKNEIDEEELLSELGEKGTGAIAASYGAMIGTLVLPGVGSVLGSMIGYTIGGILHNSALDILQREKLSEEKRLHIEAMAEESIVQMKIYSENLKNEAIKRQLYREKIYTTFFESMTISIKDNDIDALFSSIDYLGDFFGLKLQFKTFDEFNEFMNDEHTTLTL